MAAVLLMVGRGQEEPSIVSRLLDVKATPCKPYYNMAAEVPPPSSRPVARARVETPVRGGAKDSRVSTHLTYNS